MVRKLILLLGIVSLLSGGLLWAQEKKSEETGKPKPEKVAPNEEQEKIAPAEQREVPPLGGEKLQAKIEELIKKLGDEDWKIREQAQKELIKIGQSALFPLIDALDSKDPEVRLRTENILSQLEPVAKLITQLSHKDWEKREAAMKELEERGKEVLPALRQYLIQNPLTKSVEKHLAWTFRYKGDGCTLWRADKLVVEITQKLYQDQIAQEPSPDLKKKIEQLIKELGSAEWREREKTTEELKKIGGFALSFLRKATELEDAEIRLRAKEIIKFVEYSMDKNLYGFNRWLDDSLIVSLWVHCNRVTKIFSAFLSIYNKTKSSIRIPEPSIIPAGAQDPFYNAIVVIDEDGHWYSLMKEGLHVDFDKAPALTLEPGVEIITTFDLLTPDSPLNKPGKYKIKLNYYWEGKPSSLCGDQKIKAWTGEVVSNTITIELKE